MKLGVSRAAHTTIYPAGIAREVIAPGISFRIILSMSLHELHFNLKCWCNGV